MEYTRGSNLICIRSRDLKNTDTLGSNGRLTLHQPIEANEDEVLYVCVMSATFPNSWYNLSAFLNNNTISFKETSDGAFKTITLNEGSYDIFELITQIKSKLEANSTNSLTYTFTYNEITNSVNITHSNTSSITTEFDFTANTSCRRTIGFLSSIKTINSSNTSITSDRAVDITDTFNSIYIRLPNLSNQKVIESSTGKYSNIVAHIPVPLSRNTIFTYEPPKPFCMELTQTSISFIDINITFQDEEQRVHFGKGDWEVNLLIEYKKKYVKEQEPHTLRRSIMKQLRKYDEKLLQETKHFNELKKLIKSKK